MIKNREGVYNYFFFETDLLDKRLSFNKDKKNFATKASSKRLYNYLLFILLEWLTVEEETAQPADNSILARQLKFEISEQMLILKKIKLENKLPKEDQSEISLKEIISLEIVHCLLPFYLQLENHYATLLNTNFNLNGVITSSFGSELVNIKNTKKQLKEQHPFHLVDVSPHPFFVSISLFFVVLSVLCRLKGEFFYSTLGFSISFFIFLCFFSSWFYDIVIESRYNHTLKVRVGLSYGMLLFIASEVMFFASFFWAFFSASLVPTIQIGAVWPPKGFVPIDWGGLAFLSTALLVFSGIPITWAHKNVLISFGFNETVWGFIITIAVSTMFTAVQAFEYWVLSFNISDSIYGTIFYMITGFHGFHVLMGTCLLVISFIRHLKGQFTPTHHFGFVASIWYWHFVDVVWIFLYISIYVWGG